MYEFGDATDEESSKMRDNVHDLVQRLCCKNSITGTPIPSPGKNATLMSSLANDETPMLSLVMSETHVITSY